jgi:hypothetical protein
MKKIILIFCVITSLSRGECAADFVDMTKLPGTTGGSPAETVVYRGELTGLAPALIASITIQDASFGLGGAPGQFSGLDLDAIKLAYGSAGDASSAVTLPSVPAFDFSRSGVSFSPGDMRPPFDANLFGTDSSGNNPDFSVSTLGTFDGNSTTSVPGAFGFLSLGDGGSITFTLSSPVPSRGLFLYIGEVEDEGEDLTVSVVTTGIPEPSSAALLGTGAIICSAVGRLASRSRVVVPAAAR